MFHTESYGNYIIAVPESPREDGLFYCSVFEIDPMDGRVVSTFHTHGRDSIREAKEAGREHVAWQGFDHTSLVCELSEGGRDVVSQWVWMKTHEHFDHKSWTGSIGASDDCRKAYNDAMDSHVCDLRDLIGDEFTVMVCQLIDGDY